MVLRKAIQGGRVRGRRDKKEPTGCTWEEVCCLKSGLGCRDATEVKNIYCSFRKHKFRLSNLHEGAHSCWTLVLGNSGPSFGRREHLHAHGAHKLTQTHKHKFKHRRNKSLYSGAIHHHVNHLNSEPLGGCRGRETSGYIRCDVIFSNQEANDSA